METNHPSHPQREQEPLPPFLLVIDLEATCNDRNAPPESAISRHEMETIEIGAVLVETRSLRPIGELGTFVRPVRRPVLTPFCTNLTSIRQVDVDDAPLFPEAIARLRALMGGRDALFCSWGDYDNNQLTQDARYHRVALPFGGRHRNLKRCFAVSTGRTKKLGMKEALASVGLTLEGTHHRGIDDARNIARLLPWAFGRGR